MVFSHTSGRMGFSILHVTRLTRGSMCLLPCTLLDLVPCPIHPPLVFFGSRYILSLKLILYSIPSWLFRGNQPVWFMLSMAPR